MREALPSVIGCWVDDADDNYLRFTADGRCTILRSGSLWVGRAAIGADLIELRVQGRQTPMPYRFVDDKLVVTT
jgi:hypothetical protein